MGSQDGFNGCEQPEAHLRCATGCGFFGTAANMNMCSKCYRDHLKEEEQSALAKAAFQQSVVSSPMKVLTTTTQTESVDSTDAKETSAASSSESGGAAKNRCFCCNKKVGLTAIKCKCGSVFCSMHRYPEKHSCDFDYKGAGKETIAKLNPQVKADKIERI